MAYNNNFSFNPNGFQQQAAPFNPGYRGQSNWKPNYQQQPQRKRTGAKAGIGKNQKPYVRGWNFSKSRGMVTLLATPYSKTKEHKSESGRIWENWMCKIEIQRTMETRIVSALYDKMNRKIVIPELSMVINPAKDYCGTFIKRKNR